MCGKSVLLRQTIQEFESMGKHNPVVFHFDFGEDSTIMSFDNFLVKFEGMIIQTIVDNRTKLFGDDSSVALQKFIDVALRFYDRNLLE